MKNALRLTTALVAFAGLAMAGPQQLARNLHDVDGNKTVDVIVRFRKNASKEELAKIRERIHAVLLKKGASRGQVLSVIKASLYRIKAKHLTELANDPDVDYISLDRGVTASKDLGRTTVGAGDQDVEVTNVLIYGEK